MVEYFMILLMGALPQRISLYPNSAGCSTVVSIFPGPTAPVSFGGNVVQDMRYAVNMTGSNTLTIQFGNTGFLEIISQHFQTIILCHVSSIIALLVSVLSYNGQLRFWITANETICNSQSLIDEFSGYILEEVQELETSTPNPKIENV